MSVLVPDSPPAIAAVVELTEGAAYADLLHAAPPEWGCVAEETSCGWLLMAPPLDMLLFNRIVGCGGVASTLPQARRHGAQRSWLGVSLMHR